MMEVFRGHGRVLKFPFPIPLHFPKLMDLCNYAKKYTSIYSLCFCIRMREKIIDLEMRQRTSNTHIIEILCEEN